MMAFWTDVKGNKLTFREFMDRWAKGIEGITPLQQARTSIMGVLIVLTGILWGIVVMIIGHVWWLLVILIGSLIVTTIQLLGSWQKYKKFKTIQEAMKGMKGGIENV